MSMGKSIIQEKSFAFASSIVKAYKFLVGNKEFVMSKQLLRSGTSIGANVEEALAASSTADFIHKLNISAKEARETSYWLRLLYDNDYLETILFHSLHDENTVLIKMLSSIIMTTKANNP